MSIVSVHGPHTWGSKAVAEAAGVLAVVDPANGLKWDFRLEYPTTRSNQDFSWAFPPDGTPTPQLLADPAVTTYAAAGSKTATLTVTNTARTVSNKALTSNVATLTTTVAHGFIVGQSVTVAGVDATFNGTYVIASVPTGTTFTYAKEAANVTSAASGGTVTSAATGYPTAGSYPITITAIAGAGPATGLMSADGGEEPPAEEPSDVYDPADYTVAEVQEYAEANPEQIEDLIDAEEAGKNRSTLIAWLEARLITTE